jgi:hypothetical protein
VERSFIKSRIWLQCKLKQEKAAAFDKIIKMRPLKKALYNKRVKRTGLPTTPPAGGFGGLCACLLIFQFRSTFVNKLRFGACPRQLAGRAPWNAA